MSRKNWEEGIVSGFRGMLDAAFKPSKEEKEPLPYTPTSGFGRQLEAAEFGGRQDIMDGTFPEEEGRMQRKEDKVDEAFLIEKVKEMEIRILKRISQIPPKKPKRLQKQPTSVHRGFGSGFRGMLDAISSSPREERWMYNLNEPYKGLEDEETVMFQRGFFDKGYMTLKSKKIITGE